MRGLLIKDFKLIKSQMNFFLMSIVMVVGVAAFGKDSTFVVGYMAFLGALFTLSSISYDEYDNGSAFIFSLPITRKDYVAEKYLFGLLLGGIGECLATLIVIIIGVMKSNPVPMDNVMAAVSKLPLILFLLALMIPLQLKYGGEKSRIVMIFTVGMIVVIGIMILKGAELLGVDLVSMLNQLSAVGYGTLVLIAAVAGVIALRISYGVSLAIVNKKDF